MKWPAFIVLALLTVAAQVTAGAVFRIDLGGGLLLAVDLLAIVAVLLALRVRAGTQVMLAGWVLGLFIDLASSATPIGLYALTFALAAGMVFQLRGAVFTSNPVTQMAMTFVFCLVSHGGARIFIRAAVRPPGGPLGLELLQALLLALCTAVVAPAVMALVRKFDWLILPPRSQRLR